MTSILQSLYVLIFPYFSSPYLLYVSFIFEFPCFILLCQKISPFLQNYLFWSCNVPLYTNLLSRNRNLSVSRIKTENHSCTRTHLPNLRDLKVKRVNNIRIK